MRRGRRKRRECSMKEQLNPASAARRLRRLYLLQPKLGIVLGSGFRDAIGRMDVAAEIGYQKVPGFPPAGVSGHAGKVAVGWLAGTPVWVLSGRAHYYEGHPMERVTFAVRTLAELGVTDLLLTNAAGGLNLGFRPGDFMLLTDHINLMGANPLRGPETSGRSRFVDMTSAYDAGLGRLLRRAARSCGVRLRSGVYLAVSGPSYETPAEIRAFARLGADAVGMSTVPEAIAARECGLRVAGVSCITNLAARRGGSTLSHADVLETAGRAKSVAAQMLYHFGRLYGKPS
jgi:purine-nucleoside phosphorylase